MGSTVRGSAILIALTAVVSGAEPGAAQAQPKHDEPAHVFEALPDGGRIEVRFSERDTAGAAHLREHLRAIVAAFPAAESASPILEHMQDMPGARVVIARGAAITYVYRDIRGGGEIRMRTKDAEALRAVHELLTAMRQHHAPGEHAPHGPQHGAGMRQGRHHGGANGGGR